jgi:hypothetical protein
MAIATFNPEGKYDNKMDGSSHAAIYMGQDTVGLMVVDQWTGQAVHERVIVFRGVGMPGVKPCNNGDCFYVVE